MRNHSEKQDQNGAICTTADSFHMHSEYSWFFGIPLMNTLTIFCQASGTSGFGRGEQEIYHINTKC
jgi:hypothetical protein